MTGKRARIRFRKEGDLRLISHRDLLRTFERLFRRCHLPLTMSAGYHPKPKLSFPLALAVGIAADQEVMEVALGESVLEEQLRRTLQEQCPPGLVIASLELLPAGTPKAQVAAVDYEMQVPPERRAALRAAIQRVWEQDTCLVERPGRDGPLDARADLLRLGEQEGVLLMRQRVTGSAMVQPREILQVLGVSDLEQKGYRLRRTAVELKEPSLVPATINAGGPDPPSETTGRCS